MRLILCLLLMASPLSAVEKALVTANTNYFGLKADNFKDGVTRVSWKSKNKLEGRHGLVLIWLRYSVDGVNFDAQVGPKAPYNKAAKDCVFEVPLNPPFFIVARMADELNEHSSGVVLVD